MAFEVEGKLHRLFPTEQKSASFQTREFVLEVPDGNYPQLIKFQSVQERCAMLDDYREGENIKVSFDLRGREWNGKYLTNLNAWRIERVGEGASTSAAGKSPAKSSAAEQHFPADPFPNYSEAPPHTDDLPF
jgi:single-strand DNA-binding protein